MDLGEITRELDRDASEYGFSFTDKFAALTLYLTTNLY